MQYLKIEVTFTEMTDIFMSTTEESDVDPTYIELLKRDDFTDEKQGPLIYMDNSSIQKVIFCLMNYFYNGKELIHMELFKRYMTFIFQYLYKKGTDTLMNDFFILLGQAISKQNEAAEEASSAVDVTRYSEFLSKVPEEYRELYSLINYKIVPKLSLDDIKYFAEKCDKENMCTESMVIFISSLKEIDYDDEFYISLFKAFFKKGKIGIYTMHSAVERIAERQNCQSLLQSIIRKMSTNDIIIFYQAFINSKAVGVAIEALLKELDYADFEKIISIVVILSSVYSSSQELLRKAFLPTKGLCNEKGLSLFVAISKEEKSIIEFADFLWNDLCYTDNFILELCIVIKSIPTIHSMLIAKLKEYDFTKSPKTMVTLLTYIKAYASDEYQSSIISFLFEIFKNTSDHDIRENALDCIVSGILENDIVHEPLLYLIMEKGNEIAGCRILYKTLHSQARYFIAKPHKPYNNISDLNIKYTLEYNDYSINVRNDCTIQEFIIEIAVKHKLSIKGLKCFFGKKPLSGNSLCINYPVIYICSEQNFKHASFIEGIFIDKIAKTHILETIHRIMTETGNYEALKFLNIMESVCCENPLEMLLAAKNSATREYYLQHFLTNIEVIDEAAISRIAEMKDQFTTRNEKFMFYQIVSKSSNFVINDNEFNEILGLSSRRVLRSCRRAIAKMSPEKLYSLYEILDSDYIDIAYEIIAEVNEKQATEAFFLSKFDSTSKNFVPFCKALSQLITKESSTIDKLFSKVADKFEKDPSIESKAGCALIFAKILQLDDVDIDEFIIFAFQAIEICFLSRFYPCFLTFISAVMEKTSIFNDQINDMIYKNIVISQKTRNSKSNSTGGLINNGATCYINAALRSLFMIKPFTNFILKSSFNEIWQQDLQIIFGLLLFSDIRMIATDDFCSSYIFNGEPIDITVQEDSAEFLQDLINKLPISARRLFTGTLENKFIKEGSTNVVNEDFTVLWIPVKENNQLETLMEEVCREEIIKDSKGSIIRKLTRISTLPKYLIVGLRRFSFDPFTGRRTKITSKININKHLTNPGNYTMVASINHIGTTDFGHFTVTAPKGDKWILYSDTETEEIEEFDQSLAYCIIYKKDDFAEEEYIAKENISKSSSTGIDKAIPLNYMRESYFTNEMFTLIKKLHYKTMLKYYYSNVIYSFDQELCDDLGECILEKAVDNCSIDDLVDMIINNFAESTFSLVSKTIVSSPMTDFIISVIIASQNGKMIKIASNYILSNNEILPITRLNEFCKILTALLENIDHEFWEEKMIDTIITKIFLMIAQFYIDTKSTCAPELADAIELIANYNEELLPTIKNFENVFSFLALNGKNTEACEKLISLI